MGYRLNQAHEDAIVTWANGVLGIPAIWGKQDTDPDAPHADLPTLPFLKFNIPTGPQSQSGASPDKTYKSLDTWEYKFHEKFILSIQIFDSTENGYLENLMKLKRSLMKDGVLEQLQDVGLSVWTITDPTPVDEFLQTRWEFRAIMEVTFAYVIKEDDTTGEIQKVTIGKTNDPTFERTIDL